MHDHASELADYESQGNARYYAGEKPGDESHRIDAFVIREQLDPSVDAYGHEPDDYSEDVQFYVKEHQDQNAEHKTREYGGASTAEGHLVVVEEEGPRGMLVAVGVAHIIEESGKTAVYERYIA